MLGCERHFNQKCKIPKGYFTVYTWTGYVLWWNLSYKCHIFWVTKHVSGTCATNRHLSKMNLQASKKCSCWGCYNESIRHITRCTNEGWQLMFDQTTIELTQWMAQSLSHPEITLAIHSYPNYRGRVQMKRICHDSPTLAQFVKETDWLEWCNFTEARLTKTLFDRQEDWLRQLGLRRSIESWMKQFLTQKS